MIPKLICFVFGHKITESYFSGKYGYTNDRFTNQRVQVPILYTKKLGYCPRCGIKL